jgi:hypothetical protein
MKYSAGMVSKSFWYLETKKTAKYMLSSFEKSEIRQLILMENIYQTPNECRAIEIFNVVYKRLSSLDEFLLTTVVHTDITTSKVLVLFSIMRTERLFFEFVYEVFREKIILGDYMLQDRDITSFFEHKKVQSEIVANWTEATIERLKQCYTRVLYEAGLTESSSGGRHIKPANLDYKIISHMQQRDMSAYLYAVMGDF